MIKKIKKKIYRSMGINEKSWDKENRSVFRLVKFIFSVRGQKRIWQLCWKIVLYLLKKTTGIDYRNRPYKKWMQKNIPNKDQIVVLQKLEKEFNYRPKISIILPVYDPPEEFFKEALESVVTQAYSNWQLCIADDVSPNENIRTIIKSYADKDERIKYVFRTDNGHISASSNSAIEIATGDFIALLDHDDLLTVDALYQNVKALNEDTSIDFLYSDEDKINEKGDHLDAYFKPDWSPDTFMCRNYICHFSVIKTSLVKEVGGFRKGYEGSQDYDLFLRVSEKAHRIHHISKILYHWRIHSESTALNMDTKPYATNAAIQALKDTLERKKMKGEVHAIDSLPGYYHVQYHIDEPKKVSVIIPTKNKAELTNTCIQSVFEKTDYPDFEIILINNNSDEESFFNMVQKWEKNEPHRFKCIQDEGDFNFSRLMNRSANVSSGNFLLLLNNDTEVIHADWMTEMVRHAQRKSVGAVGVKLLYKNEAIQHAGVIIGLKGIACHQFVGADKNDLGYFNHLKSINNFSAVTAACLMVRKEVYHEVGGFDEELAIEFNDVDFCLKLVEAGYNNLYTPFVTLYHYESVSRGHPHKTKKTYEKHVKENNLFKERWHKFIKHDPCYNQNLSLEYDDYRIKVE